MGISKAYSLVLLLLAASSCGPNIKKVTKKSITIVPDGITSTHAILLTKQDLKCTGSFNTDHDFNFWINQYDGFESILRQINFKNNIKGRYVISRVSKQIAVRKVLYDKAYETQTTYKFNEVRKSYSIIDFKYLSNYEGLKLFVCPETEHYKHSSFESAGLNGVYTIGKTFEAVKKTMLGIKLPPINLVVAPVYKVTKLIIASKGVEESKDSRFKTDNAFFSSKNSSITFLPQSEHYNKNISSIPFWEIPMVGAHEYGHHIFNTIVYKPIKRKNIFSRTCFQNLDINSATIESHLPHDLTNHKAKSRTKRDNSSEFALKSLNEGFADLVAYYALDAKEGSVENIECFTKNREVGSAYYVNGESKVFNQLGISEMQKPHSIKKSRSCNSPNYQEIHSVGGIFAYNANRLIDLVTRDKVIKMKILLLWAKKLASEFKNMEKLTAEKYIFQSMELVYKIALDEMKATYSEFYCNEMDNIFTYDHGMSCTYL